MLETLRNAWRVTELRKKILFTVLIIFLFRLGSIIPVPFIDVANLKTALDIGGSGGEFFSYLNILTGGAMDYAALFAMSVTPYINASIIMQLLTVAIPPLERLAKEGEEGQKKIATYTRFATIVLALIQGIAFYIYLLNGGENGTPLVKPIGASAGYVNTLGFNIFAGVVIVLCFTAGSALMMWMGERIDEKGVGNGISILLFAGIISRLPSGIAALWGYWQAENYFAAVGIVILMLAVVVFIVFMTAAEHRIPIQYAKRVVGRKQYGGQNTHMPIKVNMSGVMPIIFASSILSIPSTILAFMGQTSYESLWYRLLSLVNYRSLFYALIYFLMIIGFAYFYKSIQYNPVEMANNLRKNSGAIPGIRPGKPTVEYLAKILSKVTLIGALFLGVVAVLPIVLGTATGVNFTLGGTSVLIVVGVALDTVQQLESQMLMRHYKGFLD